MSSKDDLTNLSKKEKRDYLRDLRTSQDSRERKTKLFITGLILLGVVIAIVGLVFLTGSKAKSLPKELGEKIAIDPTNGQQHINIGDPHPPYSSNPPTSGPHYNAVGFGPIECKVFDNEVKDEGVIHNLEHGAIWISYKDKNDSQLAKDLKDNFGGESKIVISPRAANDSKIAVAGWGRLMKLDSFDKEKIEQFIKLYKNGPDVPEPLAGCGTHTQQ